MKKILLVIIISIAATYANAQIQKGTIITGIHANYFSSKTEIFRSVGDDGPYRTLRLHPSAGIAVRKNLVLGVGINYESSSATLSYFNRNYNGTGLGGFAFVRKYVPLNKRFMLFGDASLYYNNMKSTSQNITGIPDRNTTKYWETGISFYPGVTYAVNKNIQLEAGIANIFNIYYNGRKNTPDPKDKTFYTRTNLSMTNPFSIGVKILLPKKGQSK